MSCFGVDAVQQFALPNPVMYAFKHKRGQFFSGIAEKIR
jgi:hypothetical protein